MAWPYGTRRWQGLRREVLETAGWRCAACGGYGFEVDHVKPWRGHPGRLWDRRNLQVLCKRCHAAKTRQERGGRPPPAGRKAWMDEVERLLRDS